MKILITGADVQKNGNQYEVVYKGAVVFRDALQAVCLVTAMNRQALERLLQPAQPR